MLPRYLNPDNDSLITLVIGYGYTRIQKLPRFFIKFKSRNNAFSLHVAFKDCRRFIGIKPKFAYVSGVKPNAVLLATCLSLVIRHIKGLSAIVTVIHCVLYYTNVSSTIS